MNVKSSELRANDIVAIGYGVKVRLTAPIVCHRSRYDDMDTYAWHSEYVSGTTETLGQYGVDMRNGNWKVQGNDRATWSVER